MIVIKLKKQHHKMRRKKKRNDWGDHYAEQRICNNSFG